MKTVLLLSVLAFVNFFSFGQMAYVGSSSEQHLYVVDLGAQAVVDSIYVGSESSEGAFTNDYSKFFVPIFQLGAVVEIDPLTHSITDTIPVGLSATQVILTNDDALAYVCNQGSNTISVIDLSINNVAFTFPVGSYPTRMALSADEGRIYVTNSFDFEVGVYSTNTFIKVDSIELPDTPVGLRMSPDGNHLYCGVQNSIQGNLGKLAIIETATNTIDTLITVGSHPHDVIVNSADTKVIVTSLDDNLVSQVNPVTYAVTSTAVQVYPTCEAFDLTEGYYYVVNTNSNSISKIDASTDAVVNHFPVHIGPTAINVFPKNLSVKAESLADILVYPNPNRGNFTIQLPDNNEEVKIQLLTMDGKLVSSYTTNQAMVEINEELATGVYLLQVETVKGVSCMKVEVE